MKTSLENRFSQVQSKQNPSSSSQTQSRIKCGCRKNSNTMDFSSLTKSQRPNQSQNQNQKEKQQIQRSRQITLTKPETETEREEKGNNMQLELFNSADHHHSNSVSKFGGHRSGSQYHPHPRQPSFDTPFFGKIFTRTVIQMDPDSDMFMKVAERAYQEHADSLVPCQKCGRRFFPDRIEQHQSSCSAVKSTSKPVWNSQTKVGKISGATMRTKSLKKC